MIKKYKKISTFAPTIYHRHDDDGNEMSDLCANYCHEEYDIPFVELTSDCHRRDDRPVSRSTTDVVDSPSRPVYDPTFCAVATFYSRRSDINV